MEGRTRDKTRFRRRTEVVDQMKGIELQSAPVLKKRDTLQGGEFWDGVRYRYPPVRLFCHEDVAYWRIAVFFPIYKIRKG